MTPRQHKLKRMHDKEERALAADAARRLRGYTTKHLASHNTKGGTFCGAQSDWGTPGQTGADRIEGRSNTTNSIEEATCEACQTAVTNASFKKAFGKFAE